MNDKRTGRHKKLMDLMAEFRKVVVQVQEENDYYREKADQKLQFGESINSTSTNLTSSTSSSESVLHPEPPRPLSSTTTATTTTSESLPTPKSNVRKIIEKFTKQKLFHNNNTTSTNFGIIHNSNSRQVIPIVPRRTRHNLKNNNMAITSRGALIVLEGLDRVGKTTLATKLVEHLNKIDKPVAHYRFPDRTTPIGKLISEMLKDSTKHFDDHAMHLLFSANRWELNRQIRQTILNGTNVIIDRYSYSGIAYSCAKRGINPSWCREVEKGLPRPDLVIYLELSKESQYGRQGFGDERFEVKEFQESIRKQYKYLIESSKEVWLKINVENKGPEQVLGEVILPVKRCIESCPNKPLVDLEF